MIQIKPDLKNKNQSFIIIVLIFIALLVLGSWLIYKNYNPETLKTQLPGIDQNKISYIINKGDGSVNQYLIEIFDDSTVFSLLEELSKKENFEIKTTVYAEMGILVDSIDGLSGGTNDKWWQYWVNNNLSEVAADKKKVNNGDIIEWKFEVIQF
jgi:hypothetical protein